MNELKEEISQELQSAVVNSASLNRYERHLLSLITKQSKVIEELHEGLELALSIMVTCNKTNTKDWMVGLEEDINKLAEILGDKDRVKYLTDRQAFRIIKG